MKPSGDDKAGCGPEETPAMVDTRTRQKEEALAQACLDTFQFDRPFLILQLKL